MKKYLLFLISFLLVFSPITGIAQPLNRPILRIGSQGEVVRELQAALQLLGFYTGDVDGLYSESTVIAVSRFQEAAQLSIDGIMGAETWNQLFPTSSTSPPADSPPSSVNANTPVPTAPILSPAPEFVPESSSGEGDREELNLAILRSGMQGEAVKRLQERLRILGLFSGEVDGIFGAQTLEAVKTFQERNNMTVDGIVGRKTWENLLR